MKRSTTAIPAILGMEVGWALAAFAAAALIFTGGCENKTEVVLDPPVVTSVIPGIAASGDTIIITGSGFNRIPSQNRVVVSACDDPFVDWEPLDDLGGTCRRASTAFAGSTTELRALVPDGAFSGYLHVENSSLFPGFSPVSISMPGVSSDWHQFDVFLNPGDVAKVFFSGTSYDYSIDTEGADDYLLILFNSASTSDDNDTFLYTVGIDAGGLRAAEAGDEETAEAMEEVPGLIHRYDLGAKLRRETGEHLKRVSGGRPGPPVEAAAVAPIFGMGAAPASVDFDVYADPYGSNTDPSSYTVVTADLKYEGTYTLLYVDQNTTPTQLSDAEAEEIGMAFESSIHLTNRSAFGSESDINDDGKVVILLSPVINAMPCSGCIILGFFNPTDLLPGMVNPACTNGMEIFYTLVPDPSLGGADWKERSIEAIKSTLAHEFQHMILYNYRVLIYGEGFTAVYMEELWLNEGLSHMAEDLNGFSADNIARADLFLAGPWDSRLTFQSDDNLENRGAVYLFLRLLGDRFGEGVYRSIVQSYYTGTTNVQRAAGTSFIELFGDWSAALFLSGSGITSDPRYNYSSIDLLGDFGPLNVTEINLPVLSIGGNQKSMGPKFIRLNASSPISYDVTLGTSSGSLNAVIIRLN
jgi:hypothetical protein